MNKMTPCYSCRRETHTWYGTCTVCGVSKPLHIPREDPELKRGLSDSNRREIAGFGIVVGLFMLLALTIGMTIATFA